MNQIFAATDRILQLDTSVYARCPWSSGDYGHMGYYGYGGHFMGLLVIILLIAVIYLAARSSKGRKTEGGLPDTPLEILKKRYARGEITKEQYEAMKKDL